MEILRRNRNPQWVPVFPIANYPAVVVGPGHNRLNSRHARGVRPGHADSRAPAAVPCRARIASAAAFSLDSTAFDQAVARDLAPFWPTEPPSRNSRGDDSETLCDPPGRSLDTWHSCKRMAGDSATRPDPGEPTFLPSRRGISTSSAQMGVLRPGPLPWLDVSRQAVCSIIHANQWAPSARQAAACVSTLPLAQRKQAISHGRRDPERDHAPWHAGPWRL